MLHMMAGGSDVYPYDRSCEQCVAWLAPCPRHVGLTVPRPVYVIGAGNPYTGRMHVLARDVPRGPTAPKWYRCLYLPAAARELGTGLLVWRKGALASTAPPRLCGLCLGEWSYSPEWPLVSADPFDLGL